MWRSWMASLTRMKSRKARRSIISFKSAAFSQLSTPFMRPVSPNVRINLGMSANGAMRSPPVSAAGQRNNSPGR